MDYLTYNANNVNNAVTTVGPSDYDPSSTNDDIRIVANAGINGDVASNHVAGTPVDGDLVIQLPAAGNQEGQEIFIGAATHSSTNLVRAGLGSGGIYGNYIYLQTNGSDTIAGKSPDGGGLFWQAYLNGSPTNNTLTIRSDGDSNWLIASLH